MLGDDKWHEVTSSSHEHERKGLELLRELLPNTDPYRVWSNFEFKDSQGRWHEVDALVLGRAGLHLVELKYYSGTLTGNDSTWHRPGRHSEDSPLLLARRKAQRLASKLKDAARDFGPGYAKKVPFIQESVFLHHPDLVSLLIGSAAIGIFGIPGHESAMRLHGIDTRLLEPPRQAQWAVTAEQPWFLETLMDKLGLAERRETVVGSWSLIEALAEGPDWQDWEASHTLQPSERARIRFQVVPEGVPDDEQQAARKRVSNEYVLLKTLQHDGLIRPDEFVDSDIGPGLVYPFDPKDERLDLWLARRGDEVSMADRLAIVRQLAEAVHYAHRNRVVHRGLYPAALSVREGEHSRKVRVGGWQSAGRTGTATTAATAGVTALQAATSDDPADGFRAPEGTWSPTANRVRLDLFGLGATAYFVLTGKAPAGSAAELRERVRDQKGLDLSVDLPQAPGVLRDLVLRATRPSPAERMNDVADFIDELAKAERELTAPSTDHDVDPLDAGPGDLLDGRFRLVRRLGAGSTAVGLQVIDEAHRDATRVLKVANDEAAAARLADEAEVLRNLQGRPRLVQLHESLTIGGRSCLLLSFAGDRTLADELASRQRVSLDLLQRWADDLFDALTELNRAGIDHRDLKPANLGVLESTKDHAKHLVLFDFSLSRASATSLSAGTAPYLDPFLGGARNQFDPAAERYAAAVVLFELATGRTPHYGDDPEAHPDTVEGDVTVESWMFLPTIARGLMAFFRQALARDAAARHTSLDEMRQAWRTALRKGTATTTSDGDDKAAAARLTTRLTNSGLTPRALSMLERFDVTTVGDLLAISRRQLQAVRGVAAATTKEVTARHREWTRRLGQVQPARPAASEGALLPPVTEISLGFRRAARLGRGQAQRVLTALLGEDQAIDPFATRAAMASHLGISAQRVGQVIQELREKLLGDDDTRAHLEQLEQLVLSRVGQLGEVATLDELVDAVLAAMPADDEAAPYARPLVRGLLRVVVEIQALDEDREALALRRREGVVRLVATTPRLLDLAESLGHHADSSVGAIDGATEVVAAERAQAELREILDTAGEPPATLVVDGRPAELAAALSTRAIVSAVGELHTAELAPGRALALALGAVGPSQRFAPKELIDRVAARFPGLAPIESQALAAVVEESGLDLVWQDRKYASRQLTEQATATHSRQPTAVPVDETPLSEAGVVGQRLLDSRRSRSFLLLGVPADQLDRLTAVVTGERFAARELNVTRRFLHQLRAVNDELNRSLPWEALRQADAAPSTSRPSRGLRTLADRAIERVVAEIDAALADDGRSDSPLLLTDASPLARYGQSQVLTRWSDLARRRPQAVWLVLPQLAGHRGAVLDGQPVQSSPNQYVPVDRQWVGQQWTQLERSPGERQRDEVAR